MQEDEELVLREYKYIEVQYDAVTQSYLRQYCIDNDFDLTIRFNGRYQPTLAFDFHSTVWYTTNAVLMDNVTQTININDIVPKGFALFGPGENILVLEIESEQLNSIRDTIGAQYALEDEWPDYRPHITLSYRYLDSDLPKVDLPDGNMITADQLHIKNQKK
jgi:2'-5' RNA ligase